MLASLAAIVAFAGLGRVLSPQYLLWVVPLLAMAAAWRMKALVVLTAAACLLTFAEFPSRYFDLMAGEPVAIVINGARNLALLGAMGICAVLLVRSTGRPLSGSIAACLPGTTKPSEVQVGLADDPSGAPSSRG